MAKAPAKPEVATDAPAPRKGGKVLLVIVIVLLVLLLAVGGVIGALILLKSKGNSSPEAAAPAAAPAATPAPAYAPIDLNKPPAFATLDPFTVNLRRDEGDHYLQAVIVLRVADEKTAERLKGFTPEIRHRINLLLSSKLPSELSTPEGREALAGEILDQSNEALGFPAPRNGSRSAPLGPVQAVLFNSFIIQ